MASSASVTVSMGDERIGMVERDLRGQVGARVNFAGQELGVTGFEQDVVKCDALVGDAVEHREKLRSGPRPRDRDDTTRRDA